MDTVDTLVGQRIRARRMSLGMGQAELGQAIGVRFQQVQKYEGGTNRVSASRLWAIAEVLETHVSHFFEGIRPLENGCVRGIAAAADDLDFLKDHDALEMLAIYRSLKPAHRNAVLSFVRSLTQVKTKKRVGLAN